MTETKPEIGTKAYKEARIQKISVLQESDTQYENTLRGIAAERFLARKKIRGDLKGIVELDEKGEPKNTLKFSQAVNRMVDMQTESILDRTEAQKAQGVDGMTGLRTKKMMYEDGAKLLSLEQRQGAEDHRSHNVGIIMLDFYFFKQVNEEYGHQAGDTALKTLARVLKDEVSRGADLVYRYGGEEFCVLLPETDKEGARMVAEKLRQAVEATPIYITNNAGVPITLHKTVSLGVSTLQSVPGWKEMGNHDRLEAMISSADDALGDSKRAGRNRVTVSPQPERKPPIALVSNDAEEELLAA